jgi:chemotaxis protein MotB
MARKKRQAEHVNHERWLVSYADFITLLFAFFVVMFAASNEDSQKAGQIAESVTVAFQELAIFGSAGKVFPLFDEGGLPSESVSIIGNTHSAFSTAQVIAGGGDGDGEETIEEVEERLGVLLDQQLEEGEVRIMVDSRGLTISLAEAGFFEPGSSVIQSTALSVVASIGEKLNLLTNNIRVEGHTDNIPIHTALFPSNWELSTSRATNVLRYLLAEARIPPRRLSAVGYSEYRPIASNDTRDGRGLNRRVDIVILNTVTAALEPKAPPDVPDDEPDADQTAALETPVAAGTQQPDP